MNNDAITTVMQTNLKQMEEYRLLCFICVIV